ncbi:hypothetical protein GB882_16715 [Georgenia ruanii]|uniref:Uncharacterized protein n=1 Tax=Georgenia ruanii TaxID=348442 RepID=A0A7J9V0B5_9MICO|nr:hypothetical protein [Georgenia ruanii]
MLVLVRRLIVTAFVAGFGYSILSTGSQGYCPGGMDADGGFVDRFGNPTDIAPSCIAMTLRPSPVVYLLLALVVVWATIRAVQRANDAAAALRALSWAGPTVILLAVGAIVVTQTAFFSIPLANWDGTSAPPVPGWLAVDVVISPMQGV